MRTHPNIDTHIHRETYMNTYICTHMDIPTHRIFPQ